MQRQSRLFASVITLVVFAALAVTPASRAIADDDQNESVVGTWIGTLSLDNSSIIITELPSFSDGGTVAGTNTFSHNCQNPSVSSSPLAVELSDYYGSWKAIADTTNKFAITLKRLIFACPNGNTPVANYGQSFPGQNVGIVSIQAVGTVKQTENGDTLTGPVTFELRNLSDQVVFAGSGTASFTRVAIEPLDAGDPALNGIGSDPTAKTCLPSGASCGNDTQCCSSFCGSKPCFYCKGGGNKGACF